MANSTSDDWKPVPVDDGRPSEWVVQTPTGGTMTQAEKEATDRAEHFAEMARLFSVEAGAGLEAVEIYVTEARGLRVLTQQDRAATAADRTATGQDRTATAADRVQTAADRVRTGQDRTQTGLDVTAAGTARTGAETARTGSETARGATQTLRNETETLRDSASGHRAASQAAATASQGNRDATAADRVQTGQDKAATAADRVATGQDKAATAADRVQTGQDRAVTGQNRAATEAAAQRVEDFDPAPFNAHVDRTDNPHGVTAAQVGAVPKAIYDTFIARRDNPHAVTAAQAGAPTIAQLNAHTGAKNNPHEVTAAQVGAVPQAIYDTFIARRDNPHAVTAAQVGAPTTAQLTAHTGRTDNPHGVTAAQVGAPTTAQLTAHTGRTDNPHGVTAAQAGAAPTVHTHPVSQITDLPNPANATRQAVLAVNAAGTAYELSRLATQWGIATIASATITLTEISGGNVWCSTVTTNRTVNLPAAQPYDGWTVAFSKLSTGGITINGNGRQIRRNGGELVNSLVLHPRGTVDQNPLQCVVLVWSGGQYIVLDEKYDFQPVQMNGGTSMLANSIKLGWDNSAVRIQVDSTSFILPHQSTSDETMKRDITDVEADALAKIKAVRLIAFNFRRGHLGLDPEVRHEVGFSAQELEKVEPKWVRQRVHPSDKLMPDQQIMFPYLVRAIQQLLARVEELENRS